MTSETDNIIGKGRWKKRPAARLVGSARDEELSRRHRASRDRFYRQAKNPSNDLD